MGYHENELIAHTGISGDMLPEAYPMESPPALLAEKSGLALLAE